MRENGPASGESMSFKFERTLTRNCFGSWQCNIPKAVAENLLKGSTSRKVLLIAEDGLVTMRALDSAGGKLSNSRMA